MKQIDTLAAGYPAQTNYLYLTYSGVANDVKVERRIIVVTRPGLNGKRLGSLQMRNSYGANVLPERKDFTAWAGTGVSRYSVYTGKKTMLSEYLRLGAGSMSFKTAIAAQIA